MTNLARLGQRMAVTVAPAAPVSFARIGERIALLDYSGTTNSARQQLQARYPYVVCGNSFLAGQAAQASYAAGLHGYNASAKILQYVKVSEVHDSDSNVADIRAEVQANDWWCRAPWPGGARTQQYGQTNEFDVNFHGFEAVNGSGQRFLDWKVIRDRTLLQAAGIAGTFIDNCAWELRNIPIDLNRDGTNESPGNATAGGWIRAGMVSYVNKLRADTPAIQICGNVQNNTLALSTDYQGIFDWVYIEGTSGASYSPFGNSWGGFTRTVNLVDSCIANTLQPRGCIWATHGLTGAADYAKHRFHLALCLMTDALFQYRYSGTYAEEPVWWNEYDLALGAPIEARTLVSTGLWRRKHQNGVVLVNTTTELGGAGSSVSYDLTGEGYRRPQASDFTDAVQDAAWNNGAAITSGSLAAGTALIGVKS